MGKANDNIGIKIHSSCYSDESSNCSYTWFVQSTLLLFFTTDALIDCIEAHSCHFSKGCAIAKIIDHIYQCLQMHIFKNKSTTMMYKTLHTNLKIDQHESHWCSSLGKSIHSSNLCTSFTQR